MLIRIAFILLVFTTYSLPGFANILECRRNVNAQIQCAEARPEIREPIESTLAALAKDFDRYIDPIFEDLFLRLLFNTQVELKRNSFSL